MLSYNLIKKAAILQFSVLLCFTSFNLPSKNQSTEVIKNLVTKTRSFSQERAWFDKIKPYCNSLEIELKISDNPAPDTALGKGYEATCFALAGQIERAELTIDSLKDKVLEKRKASSVLFGIGHRIADRGDDKSAGAIMGLVLKYQPENYMALYHAGMSEYLLGDFEKSKVHLQRFLEIYTANDSWTYRGKKVLNSILSGEKLSNNQVKSYAQH